MPLLAVLANKRKKAARRNGSCCKNPGRCRHNSIWPMVVSGAVAGTAGAVTVQALRKYKILQNGVKNPGKAVKAYRVPPGSEAKIASTLRSLFVWAVAQEGQVLTLARPSVMKRVMEHVLGKKVEIRKRRVSARRNSPRVRRNGGAAENVITVPFKAGRKYSVAQVQNWVDQNGTPAMKKRFAMAMAQYRRFHKGSLPKFITYSTYKMGSHPGISDVEFGVSEGHEWMAAYQVPRTSGKWMDKASAGRYVHAHGDSEIEVDVKRPVKLSRLPVRFHTPDGKAVGVIPSRNVKIGEWYEG